MQRKKTTRKVVKTVEVETKTRKPAKKAKKPVSRKDAVLSALMGLQRNVTAVGKDVSKVAKDFCDYRDQVGAELHDMDGIQEKTAQDVGALKSELAELDKKVQGQFELAEKKSDSFKERIGKRVGRLERGRRDLISREEFESHKKAVETALEQAASKGDLDRGMAAITSQFKSKLKTRIGDLKKWVTVLVIALILLFIVLANVFGNNGESKGVDNKTKTASTTVEVKKEDKVIPDNKRFVEGAPGQILDMEEELKGKKSEEAVKDYSDWIGNKNFWGLQGMWKVKSAFCDNAVVIEKNGEFVSPVEVWVELENEAGRKVRIMHSPVIKKEGDIENLRRLLQDKNPLYLSVEEGFFRIIEREVDPRTGEAYEVFSGDLFKFSNTHKVKEVRVNNK